MDLSRDDLDERYHELSRVSHPDHARGDVEQACAIQRSAAINDAYRALRDPWRRAEMLIVRADRDALERKKDLCPVFLMEAMDLAEQVADAAPERLPALREELEERCSSYLERLRSALSDQRIEDAAVLLHESRYCRKALRDLDQREDPI